MSISWIHYDAKLRVLYNGEESAPTQLFKPATTWAYDPLAVNYLRAIFRPGNPVEINIQGLAIQDCSVESLSDPSRARMLNARSFYKASLTKRPDKRTALLCAFRKAVSLWLPSRCAAASTFIIRSSVSFAELLTAACILSIHWRPVCPSDGVALSTSWKSRIPDFLVGALSTAMAFACAMKPCLSAKPPNGSPATQR